jgi:hypothetical protein
MKSVKRTSARETMTQCHHAEELTRSRNNKSKRQTESDFNYDTQRSSKEQEQPKLNLISVAKSTWTQDEKSLQNTENKKKETDAGP